MYYILGHTWCCLKATVINLCQSVQSFIHFLKDTIDWNQLHAKMQTSRQGNTLLKVSFMCCLKVTYLCCFKAMCMFYSLSSPSSCQFPMGLTFWSTINFWRRNLQVYFYLESKIKFLLTTIVNLDHFTGDSK